MSLPAALTVASHQGQTGQQCVVYPTVKNKKSLSFFFFFLFSCSNLHLQLQTKNTSATSVSGPAIRRCSTTHPKYKIAKSLPASK